MKTSIFDLLPKKSVVMSPEKYMAMTAAERENVKSSRFVPPSPGDNDFGRFVVMLKNPIYTHCGSK